MSVCVLNNLLCQLDVLLERLGGSIDHDRSKAVVYAVLADLEVCTVIQMKNNRQIRMNLKSSLYKLYQIDGVSILSCSLGSLKDDRRIQLSSCLGDSLDNLHIVDVESANCISALVCLLEHLGRCD